MLFAKAKLLSETGALQKSLAAAKNLPQAAFLNALVLIPLALLFHKQNKHKVVLVFVMAPQMVSQLNIDFLANTYYYVISKI